MEPKQTNRQTSRDGQRQVAGQEKGAEDVRVWRGLRKIFCCCMHLITPGQKQERNRDRKRKFCLKCDNQKTILAINFITIFTICLETEEVCLHSNALIIKITHFMSSGTHTQTHKVPVCPPAQEDCQSSVTCQCLLIGQLISLSSVCLINGDYCKVT